MLVCVALLSVVATASAQTSYNAYYEKNICAYSSMAERNYTLAAKLYEEAFADNLPFPDDLANLRDCYLAMGDTTSAVNCVNRMITCGWQLHETYPVMDFTPMENRIGAFDSARIAQITDIYPTLRQNYLQQIDDARRALQNAVTPRHSETSPQTGRGNPFPRPYSPEYGAATSASLLEDSGETSSPKCGRFAEPHFGILRV